MTEGFKFDLNAKRTRLTDNDLVAALQAVAKDREGQYFSTTKYDSLPGKRPHSATIIERFGSWKKALSLIGITSVRERKYTPSALVDNLEAIWKQLGYPPGKRQIATLGEKISERPYKRIWGSVHGACKAIRDFHNGTISREQLVAGNVEKTIRTTIPLKDRWAVMKRDKYRCVKCGASPSRNHEVELEIDHIVPISKGGRNVIENLQTLCRRCNQGKKDR